MKKFHINSKGEHGVCRAEKQSCPYVHGDTVEEARRAYEMKMEEELPHSSLSKKHGEDSPSVTTNHTVKISTGIEREIDTSTRNDDADAVFSFGQCMSLALGVHQKVKGSRVVAIVDPTIKGREGIRDSPDDWEARSISEATDEDTQKWSKCFSHFAVEVEEGVWLDSEGVKSPSEFVNSFQQGSPYTFAYYVNEKQAKSAASEYVEQNWDAGSQYAHALLKDVGYPSQ